MKILLVCVAGCLAALLPGVASKVATLPKEFKKCKRGDDVCLLDAVQSAIPVIEKGVPQLHLPSMDPLYMDQLLLDQGSGPVQIKLNLMKQNLLGLGRLTFTGVRSEMKDSTFRLEVKADLPALQLMGDYTIAGKILLLPLRGQGRNNFTLTHVSATAVITGHVATLEGDEFLQVDDFRFGFTTSRLHIDLENLFNGDKTLSTNMVAFLNDNWKIILDELKPVLVESAGRQLGRFPQTLFSEIPYGVLLPRE